MNYWHSKQDGCTLSKPYGKFNSQNCYTHNVEVCRCGWQVGFHFGAYNKNLENTPQNPKQHRLIRIHRFVEKMRERMNIKKLSDSDLEAILMQLPTDI